MQKYNYLYEYGFWYEIASFWYYFFANLPIFEVLYCSHGPGCEVIIYLLKQTNDWIKQMVKAGILQVRF